MEMKTAGYALERENELTCHVPTGQKINKSLRITDSSDIWSFSKNLKSLWTLNPHRHLWLRYAWIWWSFLELREALRYRCAEANSSPARAGLNPPPPGQKETLCLSKTIEGDGGAVNKLRLLAPPQFVLFRRTPLLSGRVALTLWLLWSCRVMSLDTVFTPVNSLPLSGLST